MQHVNNHVTSRVLLEILAQTRNVNRVNVEEIASKARTTSRIVKQVIDNFSVDITESHQTIAQETRMKMALQVARYGLSSTAKTLTWQEFENFAAECLRLAGFETTKGMIAHGLGRKWQIDLIGKKGTMMLAFDCKHWHSSYSPSRLENAARHQKEAIISMLQDVKCRKKFEDEKLWVLPLILTLLEPTARILENAVIVPLEKLSDFLNGITIYSPDLPFIESETRLTENPINPL